MVLLPLASDSSVSSPRLPCPCACVDLGAGAQMRSIQIGSFRSVDIQCVSLAQCFRLVCRRKVWNVDELPASSNLQRSGTADDEQPLHACGARIGNEGLMTRPKVGGPGASESGACFAPCGVGRASHLLFAGFFLHRLRALG